MVLLLLLAAMYHGESLALRALLLQAIEAFFKNLDLVLKVVNLIALGVILADLEFELS